LRIDFRLSFCVALTKTSTTMTIMTAQSHDRPLKNKNMNDMRLPREVGSTHLRLDDPSDDGSREVKDLFGEEVGEYHGCFKCSHNRIPGRLYATSRAILFYSSLLGFERRIYLLHQDVLDIELFRTTSISIRTTECEIYVFKSFAERENVLRLLRTLLPGTIDASLPQGTNSSISDCSVNGVGDSLALSFQPHQRSQSTDCTPDGMASPPRRIVSYRSLSLAIPAMANRRRAVSDSFVTAPDSRRVPCEEVEEGLDVAEDVLSESLGGEDPINSLLLSPLEEASNGWDDIKNGDHLQEVAVKVSITISFVSIQLSISFLIPPLLSLAS
jgi:hypothetical protein